MNNKSIFLTLLIAAFFLACGTNQKVLSKKQSASFFLKIEKTACFGSCPIYTMIILGDSKADFTGVRFVEKMGKYTSDIPDSTFRSIVSSSLDADWEDYDSSYLTGYSDLPSTILTFSIASGDTTKVMIESDIGPKELHLLSKHLEDYRVKGSWKSNNLD